MNLQSRIQTLIITIFQNIKNILKNENFRNVGYVYFFAYLAAPIGYIIRVIFSKELTLQEFGLMYSIISFYLLCSTFINLGLPQSMNYFGVKYLNERKYTNFKSLLHSTLVIQTGLMIIFSSIILIFSNILETYYFKVENSSTLLLLFLLYFYGINISKTFANTFSALKNFLVLNLIKTFELISILIFLIILIYFNSINYTSLALIWGIPYLTLAIISYVILKIKYKKIFSKKAYFSKTLILENLNYSLKILFGTAALFLITKVDIIYITYFKSVSEVGIYEIALSSAMILTSLFAPINKFLLPFSSDKKFKNAIPELKRICLTVNHILLYGLLPFVCIFYMYSTEIISILFPKAFQASAQILSILSIAIFFFIFQQLNFTILAGLNELNLRNKVLTVGVILNLILNFIFIKHFGTIGIAYSSLIVFFLMFLMSYFKLVQKKIFYFFKIKKLSLNILFIILFILSINILKTNLHFTFQFGLLIEIIITLTISFTIYGIGGLIMFKSELQNKFLNKKLK